MFWYLSGSAEFKSTVVEFAISQEDGRVLRALAEALRKLGGAGG